jgi:hypothetical protein
MELGAPAGRTGRVCAGHGPRSARRRNLPPVRWSTPTPPGNPEVLREDFYNSLCAAWTAEEVGDQLIAADLALDVERISDRHWLVYGRLPG